MHLQPKKAYIMISDAQRLELGMEFVNSAQAIGTSTTVSTAQRNWNYLQQCAAVVNYSVTTCASGSDIQLKVLRILNPSRQIPGGTQLLFIIPLVAEDHSVLTALKADLGMHDKWSAAYIAGQHFLLLKSWTPARELEKGVSLLHEAGHAFNAHHSGRMLTMQHLPPDIEAKEEEEQHLMEALLWKERGGQAYLHLLEKAIFRVGKQLTGKLMYKSLPRYDPWMKELNTFLGEVTDVDWLNNRMGHFSEFAHFEYYERNSNRWGRSPYECRVEAMKALHKKIWEIRAANHT